MNKNFWLEQSLFVIFNGLHESVIKLDVVLDTEFLLVLPAVILTVRTHGNVLCSSLKAKD